jgi:hypothetical protein
MLGVLFVELSRGFFITGLTGPFFAFTFSFEED